MKIATARLYHIFFKISFFFSLFFFAYTAAAQSTLVRGVVTDKANKETLPYVSVLIPGTSIGTTTDDEGHYSIKIEGSHTKLKFAYMPSYDTNLQPGRGDVFHPANLALICYPLSLQ